MLLGGSVDPVAGALTLAVLFVMVGIFLTTLIARRRSAREVSNEFELAKLKMTNEQSVALRREEREAEVAKTKLANDRDLELARIQSSIGLLDVSPRGDRQDDGASGAG